MPRSTKFKTINLDLAGSSNINRSLPVSIQRTINFYPEITDPDGINKAVLHSWPHSRLSFFNSILGLDADPRGMYVFQGLLYRVLDNRLMRYTINTESGNVGQDLIEEEIGVIQQTRQDLCGFADNGDTMVITNGSTPYAFDGTSLTLLTGISFNPKTVQFLNDRFIFDGADGKFYMSDVQSTNVDVANSAFPRSAPDEFIMPIVYNQIIYMMCSTTIEPWAPAASGLPPAARINQGIIENIGISSPFGVAVTPDAMFFISNDGIAYKVNTFQPQKISYAGVTSRFSSYDLSAVSASTITRFGQKFIIFSFQNDDATWVYSDTTGAWFELSSSRREDAIYIQGAYHGVSFAEAYGGLYVGNSDFSSISLIQDDSDDFSGIGLWYPVKERIMPVISGTTFGETGATLEMSKLRISMETGKAGDSILYPDNAENPVLMVSFSTDGKNFGTETAVRLGYLGDNKPIEIHNMQQFRRLYIKLKISDRGDFHLYNVSIDIRSAGY